MRQKMLIISGLCLLLIFAGASYSFPVYADPFLQEMPRLDGVTIYFTESNGEASRFDRGENGLSRFAGLVRQMGAQLETLEWRSGFPPDADLIIIAGPLEDFNADQTARLWNYMTGGGKVLLLADPLRVRPRGITATSGLFELMWIDLGVRGSNALIVQTTANAIPAEATAEVTEEPEATEEAAPAAPPPVLNFTTTELDDTHPIMQGLGELGFYTARPLDIDLSLRDFPVQPLAFTSTSFYGENDFLAYYNDGVATYNIGVDVPPSFLPLAVAFENPDSGLRLVLVGDRDFATNGHGLQSSPPNTGAFIHPDNVRFLFNSITWLLGTEPVEAEFPTPGPTATATLPPTPTIEPTPSTRSDLALTLSVSNERPVEGEIIMYELTVTNNGPDPVSNIRLGAAFPNGLDYLISSGAFYDSAVDTWSIEFIDANQTARVFLATMVRRGTVGTTLTNRLFIRSLDSIDPVDENNSAEISVNVIRVVLEEQ